LSLPESEFDTIKARLEELEEAMEVTRKDTTDLMISGGKVSKEKIM
jgi:tetrahydromethanopterin S-methyltransferase subunit G